MAQITLYLDDATQALVDQAAKAHGLSKSRWVAEVIRKYAAHEWSQNCLDLAGSFADFPLREESLSPLSADAPRHVREFSRVPGLQWINWHESQ